MNQPEPVIAKKQLKSLLGHCPNNNITIVKKDD